MRPPFVALSLAVLALPPGARAVPTEGLRGMVASASPAASEAGAAMLRAGGNAVDAAVAAAFVLAVVEPSASGLGGGGFALVRMGDRLVFHDFREVAPAAATRDMFLREGRPDPLASRDGPLAAGVPGAVAGYLALQEGYGRLKRAQVLAPAIRLAEHGFVVDERYRYYAGKRFAELSRDPDTARIFLAPRADGAPGVPAFGARLVQKDLAKTLKALAKEGAKAFYEGSVATLLAADMERRHGLVTKADLAGFRVRTRAPLVGSFRGHAIATAPPPSAGGHIVLTILDALETLPEGTARNDLGLLETYVEISRRAYADRVLFGDPAFTPDPTPQLGTKARVQRLVAGLGPKASAKVLPGEGSALARPAATPAKDGGMNTTHLCVVDADGNAVALTTTVNFWFGAGIVAAGTGVLWNDQMDDFAPAAGVANAWELPGSEANAVAPGKIPLSSMAPTMVFAGADVHSPVRLVVGAPGGARIPMQVAQEIYACLGLGENVLQALALPKLHHQWSPDTLFFERFALDPATQAAMREYGYTLEEEDDHHRWGNGTAIAVDPLSGLRTGAADPRGAGAAVAE